MTLSENPTPVQIAEEVIEHERYRDAWMHSTTDGLSLAAAQHDVREMICWAIEIDRQWRSLREGKEPPEGDRAYNGEWLAPTRELTARERDILTRVLASIIRPFTRRPEAPLPFDTYSIEARRAFERHISWGEASDIKTLDTIRRVLDPRSENRA